MGFGDKFRQAKKLLDMQKQAKAIQKELKDLEITAESLEGNVKVIFNGQPELESIELTSEAMEYSEKELADALKDAIKEAMKEAQKQSADKMKSMMGDMGFNIPGL